MKYERLPQFNRDFKKLPAEEQGMVKIWLGKVMIPALAGYEADPTGFKWPASLRFEKLTATRKILAVTWSFTGPDGRATFQFDEIDGELHCVWRRIGYHDIYKNP